MTEFPYQPALSPTYKAGVTTIPKMGGGAHCRGAPWRDPADLDAARYALRGVTSEDDDSDNLDLFASTLLPVISTGTFAAIMNAAE
ncbi:MAG TPA: hypothetical protein VMM14_06450 [Acidimicrobiia bacterium]|nr:hypothetical protein [Acidimicrobiia bacterium]